MGKKVGASKKSLRTLTLQEIVELTGSSQVTCKKYLGEAGVKLKDGLYPSREALMCVFDKQVGYKQNRVDKNEALENGMNPVIENAKLAAIKRQKIEMEMEILQKDLVSVGDVERVWSNIIVSVRNKLAALGSRMAIKVAGQNSIDKVAEAINSEVRKALDELSEYSAEKLNQSDSEGDEENSTTTRTEGE